MWKAVTQASDRALRRAAMGCVIVILGLQAVIFGIWGNDGDPPDGVVVVGSLLFWASILTLIVVTITIVRRRRSNA